MRLPKNIDAERAVIGSAIYDSERYRHDVTPEDFTSDEHRQIYAAIGALLKSGSSVDFVTLIAKLKEMGGGNNGVNVSYITELTDYAISAQGRIDDHVNILKEMAARRAVMRTAHETMLAAGNLEQPIDEVVSLSRRVGSAANTDDHKLVDLRMAAKTYLEELEQRVRSDDIPGISTGLRVLDHSSVRLYPSDLFVVGGRPGMGKTAFAVNNIVLSAAEQGKRVYVQSLEMSASQLVERILSSVANVDNQRLLRARLSDADWGRLAVGTGAVAALPIHINDKPRVSSGYVRAQAELVRQKHGLDLVVVDYIQRMREPGKWQGRRHEEVGEICQNLKALAKDLGVPVVAVSQLNRGTERNRKGSKPTMADLKESGDIEQEADTIVLLYRPEYYAEGEAKQEVEGIGYAMVEKNRKGPAGLELKMAWVANKTVFADISEEYDD